MWSQKGPRGRGAVVAGTLLALIVAGPAPGQLRVACWNVTNYSSGRITPFQTAFYAVNSANGLSMSPDVVVGQEFLSQAGVDNFLWILNNAPGSPGDWEAAPFVNGPDTDNAFFYRTSKVDFVQATVVAMGGTSPNHPRDVNRYDVRMQGYDGLAAALSIYSTHMKAGTSGTDMARRELEARRIRDDAEMLSWSFVLAGDYNIRSAFEDAYVELVGSQADDSGRFFDPINTPAAWHDDAGLRHVHTQDPVGAGGMDDRYDIILMSDSLLDGDGLSYIGNPAVPFSTSTWNDPNHSYRVWGNDGSSFNSSLTVAGNSMVGAAIAQALRDSAAGAGHLPIYVDLRVPARIDAPAALDFGEVEQGSVAAMVLTVSNAGDVALWSADGVDVLAYTMTPTAGVTVDAGPFTEPAGGGGNLHAVSIDTSSTGPFDGAIIIETNDPDAPLHLVSVTAEIVGVAPCDGDLDGDGAVAFPDLLALLAAWGPCPGCPEDLDGNGSVGFEDLLIILSTWGDCP
jgi:hypothetical protein